MLKLNSFVPNNSNDVPDFVRRRRDTLSHKYELFYQEPLIPVQANGAWITDSNGRRFLDAYNNVVSVGHSNQRVNQAITQQLGTLCTHTRYVNDELCRLSERLQDKHPHGDWRSILTCSGSEANDLGMRIAMEVTGGNGFIVSEHAYHGLTGLTQITTTSMSGYAALAERLQIFIYPVPAPCSAGVGAKNFLTGIQQALDTMANQGVRFAGGIFDSFFTSDGLAIKPEGFLQQAVEMIHRHAGIFIADEVQPGFGRSGTNFWGFQVHGAEPDIITMGKPMGNGYPTAAILMRSKLDDFIPDSYFNTFAGNNVAVAAAHAVLDEIEERDLMRNVRIQSRIIEGGLRNLSELCPRVADIRIQGLSVAVDIVTEEGLPDPVNCLCIVEAMKKRGVLISTSGKSGNTLKIRPLLIYKSDESEFLVSQITDAVLTTLC